MRVIIVEGSALGINLARTLIQTGSEVILIERNPNRAKELSETLDCTIINAEGTRPDILEKAEIENADAIVACTSHDQDNIIIGLIAKQFNVPEIIITTDDIQFMTVAKRLGFHHVVNSPQTTSNSIFHTLRGIDTIELSTMMRGDVRFISVIAGKKFAGTPLTEVRLPKKSIYIGIYRNSDFLLYTDNPTIEEGDEILITTRVEFIDKIYRGFKGDEEETDMP
ncbi:potassium channel family protein [Methanogenium organophilum]|uniref:TrkA family potassium uptake protein n=1 Tax=Methanogenium organophilum TaxID=2199 RepID=A0A9X9S261_METOG|nr:TrkA family potassium uptake protein [Methanogenium organophilum]WAI00453.1 TrkA family potassium uptake protein [Methanogenium organophilum]